MKVLVTNGDGGNIDVERDILQDAFPDVEVKYVPNNNRDMILKEIVDADAVIPVGVDFDRETMKTMKNCKIIATQTIGFDSIDTKAATDLGIYVTNNPDYCVEEVAAQAVTLLLACNRNIVVQEKLARQKIWDPGVIYGKRRLHRISDSVLGVVALGHIGRRVTKIMQSMGVKVIGFDPFLSDEAFKELNVQKVDTLEELFAQADMITLHTPLTPKTAGMVNKDLLNRMKDTAILVNTSRGGIINEDDLYDALKEGKLAAAGLDVIADERTCETKLYELDNALITPHMAYYTEESLIECRRKSAQMVVDLIAKHETPKYLVNKDIAK